MWGCGLNTVKDSVMCEFIDIGLTIHAVCNVLITAIGCTLLHAFANNPESVIARLGLTCLTC
ncbi:hypothetical protein Plhal304r1_c005g0019781 [Plasmopara halstedii]